MFDSILVRVSQRNFATPTENRLIACQNLFRNFYCVMFRFHASLLPLAKDYFDA